MTVAVTTIRNGPYVGDGIVVDFPYTFYARSEDEVAVVADGVTLTGGYSVALNDDYEGGTVTFDTAPVADAIFIDSDPDFEQNIDLINAGPFHAEVIGEGLDRAAVRSLFLKRSLLPLDSVSARALKILGWDENGNPIATVPVDGSVFTGPSTGIATVMWHGAVGDGAANDQAAFDAAFAAHSRVHIPAGTFIVNSLEIPPNITITTEGFDTIIQQAPGTGPDTPIISIGASNIFLGSLKVQGQLDQAGDTTGEQNHGILIKATALTGNLSSIRIDDILGQDIRGDVVLTYSTDGATIDGADIGRVKGDNVYRNVVGICTGNGVSVESATGTGIGYAALDVEPDGTCAPVVGLKVGYVKGRHIHIAGTDDDRYVDGVEIGTADLDPAYSAGSSPAYAPGAALVDGAMVRNCKSLEISKFKANGFDGQALRHIYNSGELAVQDIRIGMTELTDCCKTEATNLTYIMVTAGVVRLSIEHLNITITRASVSGVRGAYGLKMGQVDASLAADTRLLHVCNDAIVGPIYTLTTTTGLIAVGCDGAKIIAGSINVDKVFSFSSDTRIEGGTITVSALVEGTGGDVDQLQPVIIDSIINGSRYSLGIWQEVILYRDGHTLAGAYHHSSGDKVVGARGAAIADAAHSAAAPTKAEFDALVDSHNTLLARLRAATGHGLIA